MFVAREIKQTLLRKFGKVFFDSPFISEIIVATKVHSNVACAIFSEISESSSFMHVLQKGVSLMPILQSWLPKSVFPSFNLESMSAVSLEMYFDCRLIMYFDCRLIMYFDCRLIMNVLRCVFSVSLTKRQGPQWKILLYLCQVFFIYVDKETRKTKDLTVLFLCASINDPGKTYIPQ